MTYASMLLIRSALITGHTGYMRSSYVLGRHEISAGVNAICHSGGDDEGDADGS